MQSLQELKNISEFKKKKNKHDKTALFGKDKLNTIKVLISKSLIALVMTNLLQ